MGCTASKLDNEDTVRRCKERRRLIKDAVFARHHLAAAHADYCRSLRITGGALAEFAAGEPLLIVSPETPSVLLHNPIQQTTLSPSQASNNKEFSNLPKPPPPIKTTTYHDQTQENYEPKIVSSNLINNNNLINQKGKKGPKLPHILSDSSVSSATLKSYIKSFGQQHYNRRHEIRIPCGIPDTYYASTPSQASSVWNWDNFYPTPSPPGSDFLNCQGGGQNRQLDVEERESDDGEVDGDDERDSRSEISKLQTRSQSQSHFGSSPELKKVVKESVDDGESSRSWKKKSHHGSGGEDGREEMRMVVRHKDLKEMVGALREYFEKAAEAGDQVAVLLETGRDQIDRSFRQLKSECVILFCIKKT